MEAVWYNILHRIPKKYSFLEKQIWSNVSNLKFTRKDFGKVHIEMRFILGEKNHSDGRGGDLGRASYPRLGGDIFFDDEELWRFESYNSYLSVFYKEINFLLIATHELGHALGLEHSEKVRAVMTPDDRTLYQVGKVRLDVDDVQAIQALYGAPGQPRPKFYTKEEADIDSANRRFIILHYNSLSSIP